MNLIRWWNQFVTAPARFLMKRLSSQLPRRYYDHIEIVVVDPELASSAERFFERTEEALSIAASHAPRAYAGLCKDVQRIILWGGSPVAAYHKFQLAAVVPSRVAFESDILYYAAWLLHTSGLSRSPDLAQMRVEEFLESLNEQQRTNVMEWLAAANGNR